MGSWSFSNASGVPMAAGTIVLAALALIVLMHRTLKGAFNLGVTASA